FPVLFPVFCCRPAPASVLPFPYCPLPYRHAPVRSVFAYAGADYPTRRAAAYNRDRLRHRCAGRVPRLVAKAVYHVLFPSLYSPSTRLCGCHFVCVWISFALRDFYSPPVAPEFCCVAPPFFPEAFRGDGK